MTRGQASNGSRPHALARGDRDAAGNKKARTHGAGTTLRANARPAKAVLELASKIADAYLGGVVPAQLTRPEFMASVESWARREARARILSDYLDGLSVEEMISPTRAGAVKSVFEIWLSRGAQRGEGPARPGAGPLLVGGDPEGPGDRGAGGG